MEKKKQVLKVRYRCPRNSNHKVESRGKQIYCFDCLEFFSKSKIESGEIKYEKEEVFSFHQDGEHGIVQATTDEVVKNEQDLIRVCNIDTSVWEIERFTTGINSGYRKNRKSSWHVEGGTVISGHVEDTGEILRAPLYNVKGWLVRKSDEIRKSIVIKELIAELSKKSPKIHTTKYPKKTNGNIYEIDMPDLHFGKLTHKDESGEDYNIEIATRIAKGAIAELLEYSKFHKVEKILLPWGNDFFNSDSTGGSTTKGTPQQNDELYRRTFKLGRQLAEDVIAMCLSVAPVDVLMMPGNHDTNTVYFLGEVLHARYSASKHVTVDAEPMSRKYRHYDRVLLGFAHGEEKVDKLPVTMFIANKDILGHTEYREWHLGHQHHKKQMELMVNETLSCTLRYLSSLTATDQWHFDNQYTGAVREAQSFLWNRQRGLVAQYHSTVK